VGRAVPGNVNGAVTPKQHNAGGYSGQSPYTSWTTRKQTAEYYARRYTGGLGVILTKTVARTDLVASPDRAQEGEVLLRGPVLGCQVEEVPGTGPIP